MNTGQDTLTYVYAIARQTEPLRELLAGLQGVGRAPVVLLAADPGAGAAPGSAASPAALALLVSPVPQQDFNETALKDHFEDLEWLEEVARAHHEVVQAVAARETVLPLRMATVYQDDGRARRALTEQQPAFARRLAELDGHTEYGVKVYLDPSAPPAATPPEMPPCPAPPRRARHTCNAAKHSTTPARRSTSRRSRPPRPSRRSPRTTPRTGYATPRKAEPW